MTTFTRALREARADRDASHAHGGVARRDYLTQVSASSSQSKWRKALRWMLDERVILLDLQEMDLGVHKMTLAGELERGQCHTDGR
jgi:hypothetical protein